MIWIKICIIKLCVSERDHKTYEGSQGYIEPADQWEKYFSINFRRKSKLYMSYDPSPN